MLKRISFGGVPAVFSLFHCFSFAVAAWLFCGLRAPAAESAVSRAVQFLADQQSANGMWNAGAAREKADTLTTLTALAGVSGDAQATMALLRARTALALRLLPDTPATLDLLLELAGADNADPAPLLAAMNADGGWGPAADYSTSVPDTLLAVEALLDRGLSPDNGWNTAAELLAELRAADGFWQLSDEAATADLALSARVVRTLRRLKNRGGVSSSAADSAAAQTVQLLRQTYRADGSFSQATTPDAPLSLLDTAEVYRTLVLFDQPALYADTVALLNSRQQPDGSWHEPGRPEQDIYTTAIVLQALLAVQPPPATPLPNLVIMSAGISFSPAAPAAGDTVTVNAVIFNRGTAMAENVRVEFHRGDPRAGGSLIGSAVSVAAIAPGASAAVSVSLDTAALTAGPLIYVSVDPLNTVAETSKADNLASRLLHIDGLLDAQPPAGIDLYTTAAAVTFNGRPATVVYLINSPTVMIGFTVANLGTEPAGSFQVLVKDGPHPVGLVTVPELAAGAQTALSIPWYPETGLHEISITVDSENAVVETDKDNNAAALEVQVIGATSAIFVHKFQQGIELEPPFSAYDTGRFTVMTAHENAEITITVTGPDGAPARSQAVPLFEIGRHQWNVVNNPPGSYSAEAVFADADTGTVLDTDSANFEVLPTAALRSLQAFLPTGLIESGSAISMPVTVTLANGSNIDTVWSLSWELLDPNGASVLSAPAPEQVAVGAGQMSKTTVLTHVIEGTLTTAGRYTVRVTAAGTDVATPATGYAHFVFPPPLHLSVTNQVIPDEVAPLGKVRVRTLVRLAATGENYNLKVPAAIRELSVQPGGNIPDSSSATVSINASGIVNAIGNTVDDGTRLAVYVPYGTITGGDPAPGSAPNPQIRIFSVQNGAVSLQYSPRGDALSSGQYSLTVMQFHQFLEEEDEWFGKNIGNAEIFLQGQ